MGKHAFLVMAYDDEPFLKILLGALDGSRSDIYIHIDKRSKIDPSSLEGICKYASVVFVDRINVTWGSENQIAAELLLLKASTTQQKYDYYHLISGHDFPLVSMNVLYQFFDNHCGMEFIDCRENNLNALLSRIKYYYPFQTFGNGKSFCNRAINSVFKLIQKIFKVDRTSKKSIKYGFGANWFSITDSLARYVVTQEGFIKQNFYKGLCADEMFLQTVWLNSPLFEPHKQFRNNGRKMKLEPNCRNALRAVDFSKGDGRSPRVFDEKDYDLLEKSDCIFGRKMDSKNSMSLIKKIQSNWV